jgi:hypothetical protein
MNGFKLNIPSPNVKFHEDYTNSGSRFSIINMSKKTPVSVLQCDRYEHHLLKTSILELFKPFEGIEKIIKRNDRILIKPNTS